MFIYIFIFRFFYKNIPSARGIKWSCLWVLECSLSRRKRVWLKSAHFVFGSCFVASFCLQHFGALLPLRNPAPPFVWKVSLIAGHLCLVASSLLLFDFGHPFWDFLCLGDACCWLIKKHLPFCGLFLGESGNGWGMRITFRLNGSDYQVFSGFLVRKYEEIERY